MATAAELLEEVNDAISKALTAQSFTIRGRSQQLASLAELRKFRQELIAEIGEASNNSGSMCTLGEVMPPTY